MQTLETTVILQQLGKLDESVGRVDAKVSNVQRSQEHMNIQLLGGADEETKHGRLPIVENAVANHDLRLASLETDRIRWKAYAIAAAAIGGAMGGGMNALIGLIHALISGK